MSDFECVAIHPSSHVPTCVNTIISKLLLGIFIPLCILSWMLLAAVVPVCCYTNAQHWKYKLLDPIEGDTETQCVHIVPLDVVPLLSNEGMQDSDDSSET